MGDLDFVFLYLDDILISSGTEEDHSKYLRAIFDHLHNLLEFLRRPPYCFSRLRAWWRKVLQPLAGLMKKSALFLWGKDQKNLFRPAKRALFNTVTFQHQSPSAQVLNTDASWAMLMQCDRAQHCPTEIFNLFDRELLTCYLSVKKFCYRVFIKYCVFSLKFCDFSELCQFSSAGALPAWCVYTHWHHRWKTERGKSPEYF